MEVFLFFCCVFVGMMLWEIYPEWPFRSKKKTGARERRGQWGVGVPQIEWQEIKDRHHGEADLRAQWEDITLCVSLIGHRWEWVIYWDDTPRTVAHGGDNVERHLAIAECIYAFSREWKARQYDQMTKRSV